MDLEWKNENGKKDKYFLEILQKEERIGRVKRMKGERE